MSRLFQLPAHESLFAAPGAPFTLSGGPGAVLAGSGACLNTALGSENRSVYLEGVNPLGLL
jgi:hypothetical protein